jgi:zinc protease
MNPPPAGAVDRSEPPPPGPRPAPRLPRIERARLANGVRLSSARRAHSLETTVELALPGGRARQPPHQLGLASLAALGLTEGTRARTTVEFLDALDALGADLQARAAEDEILLVLRALDRNLEPALALFAASSSSRASPPGATTRAGPRPAPGGG